jgi:hypothetical protein
MKKQLLIALAIGTASFIASCKKESKTEETATPEALEANDKQFNADANFYKGESDQSNDDINTALKDIPAFRGGSVSVPEVLSSPLCGVTIDSSQIDSLVLFFNFDGVTPCFNPTRTRSGQIKVRLTSGAHWSDVNAVLTIDYINFKVTRLYDNKSIRFNGTKTLQNINGNDWLGFILGTATLKYRERALSIHVDFDNGSNATWNCARITQWNYTPSSSKITFTASGDTTLNSYSNVDSWGVNRFGMAFTTNYNSPVVSNTYCGLWNFISGELVHHVNNRDFTLTLGVDQNGNPTPYACAYGYKVTWTSLSGVLTSVVLSY